MTEVVHLPIEGVCCFSCLEDLGAFLASKGVCGLLRPPIPMTFPRTTPGGQNIGTLGLLFGRFNYVTVHKSGDKNRVGDVLRQRDMLLTASGRGRVLRSYGIATPVIGISRPFGTVISSAYL